MCVDMENDLQTIHLKKMKIVFQLFIIKRPPKE